AAREGLRRIGRDRDTAIPLARLTTTATGRYGAAAAATSGSSRNSWRRRGRIAAAPAAGRATTAASAPSTATSPATDCSAGRGITGRPAATFAATAVGRRRRGSLAPRLRLVHPHHAVVVVGDRSEVAG